MSLHTSTNLNYLLDEVTSAVVFEQFVDPGTFLLGSLYTVRGTSKARERITSVGGIRRFQQKQPGVAGSTGQARQQFQSDIVPIAFQQTLEFEREFIDDEEWGTVQALASELGTMARYSMEEDAAGPFNDAFDGASYTAEDDVALCGTHTNAQSGNSQVNKGTTAMSMTSIKSTRDAMRKFTNYSGDKITIMPDALIVAIEGEETAWEIIRSKARPDTANDIENLYNGMFVLIVMQFLDDEDDWFMVDRRLMKKNLIWLQRIALETFGDGDLFVGQRREAAYYRQGHRVVDWRWCFGHEVP